MGEWPEFEGEWRYGVEGRRSWGVTRGLGGWAWEVGFGIGFFVFLL